MRQWWDDIPALRVVHHVSVIVVEVFAGEEALAFAWALARTVLDEGEGLVLA